MKDYTLTQQYALLGLNGLDALHNSTAKTAVIRGIVAAKYLETALDIFESEEGNEANAKKLQSAWQPVLNQIRKLSKKEAKSLEEEITAPLIAEDTLQVIPDILACDINYDTAGVDIKAYRTDDRIYNSIAEEIRAEILEPGTVSAESFILIWLMRESGCLHDHFSTTEQVKLNQRMIELTVQNPVYRMLWEEEFHSILDNAIGKFLKGKSNLFKNPYLEGVNLIFPFLERRQAIFIDFVVLGTTVASRRIAVMEYLSERGHYVEEIKNATETLLKVDNNYYRIFPATKRVYKVPVQGANLVPVYY